MRAIVLNEFGGPEVLRETDVQEPEPRPAHRLLRVRAAGLNYADIHVRQNSYLAPVTLPYIPGNEVIGVDDDGRRVVALTTGGGYAEAALAHRSTMWEVPEELTDHQALALTLQGHTAWHLLHTCLNLTDRDTVVIPAAAGGVGSLAVQLAAQAGARVVALASTPERRDLAARLGAQIVIDSTAEDLTGAVLDAANGPVSAALEMTGGRTHEQLLAALAPRGRMAVYGYAGGAPAPSDGRLLLQRSLTVTGFWLPSLYAVRGALDTSAKELFAKAVAGDLEVITGGEWPLAQAADAHRALEARTVTGKGILRVSN